MTASLPLRRPAACSSPSFASSARLNPWIGMNTSTLLVENDLFRKPGSTLAFARACFSGSCSNPKLLAQADQHVGRHAGEIVFRREAPVGPRGAGVERARPGFGDRLAHRVDLIVDGEGGDVLANFRR